MKCLLSTAYFPPVEYFVAIANCGGATVERHENYRKQSWRNRCAILSADGVMSLNIPVRRGGAEHSHRIPISEVLIDYSEQWLHLHKRAIDSAYMNSPFFEYYRDDLFSILDSREPFLIDLNTRLTRKLLEFCGIRAEVSYTEEYRRESAEYGGAAAAVALRAAISAGTVGTAIPAADEETGTMTGAVIGTGTEAVLDLRSVIHPKYKGGSFLKSLAMEKPYWQVFSAKQGFVPNLSVMDLLFNEGPNAISYLML